MGERVLTGHKVAKGKTEGEALVSRQSISFMYTIDPETGVVKEKGHDLEGKCISGKILVYPVGKGSSAGSYRLYEMLRNKTNPKGIINLRADPVDTAGAIFCDIPMIDQLDGNPLELIKTGDHVELDADQGMVTVKARP